MWNSNLSIISPDSYVKLPQKQKITSYELFTRLIAVKE